MASSFEGGVLAQTCGVAIEHNIEPECLLAVVQVESDGKALEVDGKTPCLLFERHIFYRELVKAKGPAATALQLGLANIGWRPSTQYKDQNTSQKRLDLFARARRLHEMAAIRSCSWGVGQTMGFLAEELKFRDALAMFNYMVAGGIPAQVECMVREIENKRLTPRLNDHQWAAFARVYNGPGYAQNNYDSKMAVAWAGWKKRGVPIVPAAKVRAPAEVHPTGPVTPPKVVNTANTSVTVGGTAAVAAASVAAFHDQVDYKLIGFGVFVVLLVVVTAIILWRRHQAASVDQLGVLSSIATE